MAWRRAREGKARRRAGAVCMCRKFRFMRETNRTLLCARMCVCVCVRVCVWLLVCVVCVSTFRRAIIHTHAGQAISMALSPNSHTHTHIRIYILRACVCVCMSVRACEWYVGVSVCVCIAWPAANAHKSRCILLGELSYVYAAYAYPRVYVKFICSKRLMNRYGREMTSSSLLL